MNLDKLYRRYLNVKPVEEIEALECQAQKRRDISYLSLREMRALNFITDTCPACNYAGNGCFRCPLPGLAPNRCLSNFIEPFRVLVNKGDLRKVREFLTEKSQELFLKAEKLREKEEK